MEGDINIQFSSELKLAINIAQSYAKENFHEKIFPAHLLKALFHKDVGLSGFLLSLNKDIYYLEEWADVRMESCPKCSGAIENPSGDDQFKAVLNEADNIRIKLAREEIDPICALTAICMPGVGFTHEQLKSFTLTSQEVLDAVKSQNELASILGSPETAVSKDKKAGTNAILKFCIDKNEEAIQQKLDPVVGRDSELRTIAEILGRRTKSNVLILGDAGVGKTALVNGFTQTVIAGKVPENLKTAKILELDFGSLIAGASYKGEVEDRLKSIIKEIQQFERAILFIDEIHMLLDQQGGTAGAANLLKPELSRGNLTIIGTTSVDNYTKFIEADEAFNRQFEIVKIDEPDEPAALRMLKEIIPAYENHHHLKADEEVITEAVRLSKRFLKERSLPDSAIDLIDHAMSGVRLMNDISPGKIEELIKQLESLKPESSDGNSVSELEWFYSDLKNQISPILFSKLSEEEATARFNSSTEIYDYCKKILSGLKEHASNKIEALDKSDVGAIVSARTGIPLGKVQSRERDRLMNIEQHLKKRVVGQDHALKSISEAILESRSGLNKAGQPIGSFFFLGPTGTGKTELAKSLSEFLFQDESFLIRFDMSEFKEEHSAALLYGAPPGYVGYEEGGLLVNKIRQKPYSVVLFDEIEKAHSSVFDIFLQILDEGKLHDRLGKEGDFSNAIILFTSNIGSKYIVDSFEKGEIPPSDKLMEIMSNHFRPEFLGRLTEIVPFAPINKENVVKIFDIHMKSLYKSLEDKGIILSLDQDVKEKLAMSGFSPKYGARPIVGVIRSQLRRPLSRMIIADEIRRGSEIQLTLGKTGNVVWKTNQESDKAESILSTKSV
jgi:ATP-dependent Clp protease ATP-binding subunit ClpA